MRKFILAVLIVLSMTMGFDALALAPVTASPWTTTTNPYTARTGLVVYSTSEVNALITAATNALATTNYVNSITNGLATTNYAKSVTNNFTALVYTNPSSILYTSSLPALTNGFVTSSITNGLATTNYVNAATNGLVTSSITNGLATTNYVNTSIADKTNFPGIYVTNSAYIGTTFAQGNGVTASGLYSSAFGFLSLASGNYSHVEGSSTIASGTSSHAEGSLTVASAGLSHAEGSVTIASGYASHAEGDSSTASGQVAHAEGYNTTASGEASHAAGAGARATNDNTYVWSDNTAFGSTTTAQYSVYAANGIRLLGGPIFGNGVGLTNIASTNLIGLGTAAYSNATAFYLNSNPSNYVTASVTNGLATTNYVLTQITSNGIFGDVGLTNGSITASNLLVLQANTNIIYFQFTNAGVNTSFIWGTNKYYGNALGYVSYLTNDMTGIPAGQQWSIYLTGVPGYGTKQFYYTTNLSPITTNWVYVGVVTGQGLTNSIYGTNTVLSLVSGNIVSGSGIFTGNGAGLTNIAATNLTGLGTAAYSNATAFYLNSNPSNYITTSVTNGLATTNFVNTSIANKTNFDNITVTNFSQFQTNAYFAGNIYVTNHAYDVSTSQLDPIANEYVTAQYVQSIMAANFDLYFSTNSSGITVTNGAGGLFIPSTMVLANPITSQTNTISSWTNGTYFTARLQTNSISYIQSVPINLYTYVQITGGGSVTAHPEMWLYNTNGTIVQLGYSSDNTYSSDIAVPVNLAIAMTNTAYLNVNLTNSPKLLLRWYVTSHQGNPTWRFLIGAGNVSHITVGTIPSANQNYVGTFTGNGVGLTNIPITGITGLGTAAYSNATAFMSAGNTNFPGIYVTNNVVAMTNLGIRTASPAYPLDVFTKGITGGKFGAYSTIARFGGSMEGNVFIDATAGVGNAAALVIAAWDQANTAAYGYYLGTDNNGNFRISQMSSVNQAGYTDAKDFSGGLTGSMTLDKTGKLGIGTIAPAKTLDVQGDVNISGNTGIGATSPRGKLDVIDGTLYSIGDSPGFDTFDFVGDSSGAYSVSDSYYQYDIYSYKNTPLGRVYSVNPIVFAGTDSSYVPGYGDPFYMQWNLFPTDGADGYRVIVVSDPSYGAYGDYYFDTTSTYSQISVVAIGYEDESSQNYTAGTPVVTPKTIDTRSQFYFDSSPSNIIAMPFKYFGIGTTNPAYTLDVNGSGHFVGAVKFDANITGALTNLAIYNSTNYNERITNSTIIGSTITNTTIYNQITVINTSTGAVNYVISAPITLIKTNATYNLNLIANGVTNTISGDNVWIDVIKSGTNYYSRY